MPDTDTTAFGVPRPDPELERLEPLVGGLALEPGHLPDKRVVSERAAEASFSQSGQHL